MTDNTLLDARGADELLEALGEQLTRRGERHTIAVVGGSALIGDSLEVLFASRLDQIHFKLYAAVDQGAGRHLTDLKTLAPSQGELIQAAHWSETHDPSDGYREVLLQVLAHLGVDHGPPRA